MYNIKFVVEKHSDGYIAYPLGVEGAVVGEGETYEATLADAESATRFHIETFCIPATHDKRQNSQP